ncbi:hypothetical protein MHPYR_60146 [uncultured Mycobacterium sp.]|uniref:Uncharacterized protein n=1 Tax=uncultured Mycobacterium sp. TaxID=171292 RepID=A0A1Y5PRW0_9MYCO|nr:hypothetical protein MHPYR_60146 [uncultured Mycobacterium sp.]
MIRGICRYRHFRRRAVVGSLPKAARGDEAALETVPWVLPGGRDHARSQVGRLVRGRRAGPALRPDRR